MHLYNISRKFLIFHKLLSSNIFFHLVAHGQDYIKSDLDRQTKDNIIMHKDDLKQAEVR